MEEEKVETQMSITLERCDTNENLSPSQQLSRILSDLPRAASKGSIRSHETELTPTLPVEDPSDISPRSPRNRKKSLLQRTSEVLTVATRSARSSVLQTASRRTTFIKRSFSVEERETLKNITSPIRRKARQLLRQPHFETVSGFVVLMDFVAICRDTDSSARGAAEPDLFSAVTMNACFVFYIFDLLTRIVAGGCGILKQRSHMLDAFIICVSVFEHCVELVRTDDEEGSSLLMIRMVRLCRLLRLVRVIKLFSGMKELRRLTQMIATCGRTMFWSFLMSFLVMSMWSVAAVELAYPVAQRLAEEGVWEDCERCKRAFSSVTSANLTFFQTILAGDSWGLHTVPIIEAAPGTAVVFCGALLTLSFGIMQLITAVVVDTFADLRKMDVNGLADEMEAEEKHEKDFLFKIFRAIDADQSGMVTYEELTEGALKVKDFQDWLRVMDIDEGDLARLFSILDADNKGEIDLVEFVDVLYRMRNAEQKTTAKLMKHILDNVERTTQKLVAKVDALHVHVAKMPQLQQQPHKVLEQPLLSTKPNRSASHETVAAVGSEAVILELEASLCHARVMALESALRAAGDRDQIAVFFEEDRSKEHASFFAASRQSTSAVGDTSESSSPWLLEHSNPCKPDTASMDTSTTDTKSTPPRSSQIDDDEDLPDRRCRQRARMNTNLSREHRRAAEVCLNGAMEVNAQPKKAGDGTRGSEVSNDVTI
eukprot:TRINITY_DN18411_c0_g3_i3.p1 TRINITY_DN18411_c0_g3~~TRINITY_DN18411_c0_g3_i3.p1  ORF type:complete len:712 (+),score=120.35 TRINITY_DN18411_c0_g3_i3:178-2313(+)